MCITHKSKKSSNILYIYQQQDFCKKSFRFNSINAILILLVVFSHKIELAFGLFNTDKLLLLRNLKPQKYGVSMKRNGIKNFIFSFFMSLLAVVVVNKAVFDAPESTKPSERPTSSFKSISLFSKAGNDIVSDTSDNLQFNDIENLVSAKADIDVLDLPAIDIKAAQAEPVIVYNSDLDDKELSTNNEVEHSNYIDIASASQIVLDKSATPNNAVVTPVSEVVYSDISDTFETHNDSTIQEQKSQQEILVAQNDIVIEEENLIPITEGDTALHNKIDVLTSSENTQIAMLEPSTLVNSIESFDEPEEKHIVDINLKENVISTAAQEQTSSNNDDNPWVVAQGNRFAKNQIAQINALEEENTQNISVSEAKENIIKVHKEESTENKSEADSVVDSDINVNAVSEINATEGIENNEPKTELKVNNQSSLLEPKPLLIPTDEQGTKLAYKMIQNLIIPLPDDIATDADIIPQLSSEPNKNNGINNSENKKSNETKELKEKDKESGLFKSISSWFSRDKEKDDNKKDTPKLSDDKKPSKKSLNKHKSGISLFEVDSNSIGSEDSRVETPEIMPAELKLSFQPNRAEISGYTLRWIHAFADNARDNADIYIEIRIDGTNSFALQQKRLNLLSSIFANRGVDFRKVNVIFTSREPNSFIIRNLKFNNSEELNNENNNSPYYQHW